MEDKCFKKLMEDVKKWGDEKGITNPDNVNKQFLKFIEEVFELKTEVDMYTFFKSFKHSHNSRDYSVETSERYENLNMEMGDVLVTLTILSRQLDIDLVKCLDMAYQKIKTRKGKTINGTFIKESDLNEESRKVE